MDERMDDCNTDEGIRATTMMMMMMTTTTTTMTIYDDDGFVDVSKRFVNFEDLNWFLKTMVRVASEDLGEGYGEMVKPFHYFVDFLRSALFGSRLVSKQ
jgi:hypothetical protein